MKDSRRQFLRFLGLSLGSMALPARHLWGAEPRERVRLALRRNSLSSWPVLRALAGGHAANVGLALELQDAPDEEMAARALIRGEVEAAVLPTPLFLAVHLGTSGLAPAPYPLATFQVALTDGSTLVVRQGSGIEFSRQFAGRTVGIATPWGMPKLLTDIYLLQSGLKPGEDTSWQTLAPGEMGDAVRQGRVDALAVEEWLPTELVRAGDARTIMPLQRLWQEHPAEVVAVSSRFREEEGEVLERLAGALLQGAADLQSGPGKEVTSAAAEGYRVSAAGHYPFPFQSALRIILEEMKKRSLTRHNLEFQEVVDEICLADLCRDRMRAAGFREVPAENSRDERMMGCCYTF